MSINSKTEKAKRSGTI